MKDTTSASPNQYQQEIILNDRNLAFFSLALLAVLVVALFVPFCLVWDYTMIKASVNILLTHLFYWIVPIIILHEALHGMVWAISVKKGYKHIQFGFNRAILAPYTHCKIPMQPVSYLLGGIAPCLLMGIVPATIAFIAGSGYWLVLGLICIWVSAGDILSCWKLIRLWPNALVLDHPQKAGFIIVPYQH